MPATVNGIGTKYYGKKNVKAYRGRCEFCHRDVELQEYETMYWFVVVYVPLIPLGRKQILSYCTSCRRHRVLPLATWDQLKEQAIAQDTSALGQSQDDPQAALKLLETLSAFNRFDEAEKLAAGIQDRFYDHADVQLRMGQWHDFRGRRAEADACYRVAFELQPQNLTAKRAVAFGMIADGQPDKALALIEAPPEISPRQDPALHFDLGKSYQQRNQHHEALAAFQQVLEAAPKLGYDKKLRQLVRTSEKLAAAGTSMLPRVSLYRSPGVLIAAAAAAIVAGILFCNFYIFTHRTLHVVNGFNRPVTVQLDDRPSTIITPHKWQTFAVSEGTHRALVSAGGKFVRSDDFEVSSGFLDRFFNSPVFIVNAGGGAAILWEQAIYSAKPGGSSSTRLQVGTPFAAYADVDFHFVQFPQTLKSERGKSVTKTRVDLLELQPRQIFFLPPGTLSPEDQLTFAEAHLPLAPDDKPLLQAYVQVAAANQQIARARKFLESGLDQVPVRIEWHRMAQHLNTNDDQNESLRERYARWLQKDPANSAILYLSGRLEPHYDAAMAYYERAIAADRANPYPWFAKGYQLQVNGDFPSAKTALLKAAELRPADEDFRGRLFDIRFALGEHASLEHEMLEALKDTPHMLYLHLQLLEVLAARNKLSEAREFNAHYVRTITSLADAGNNEKQAATLAQLTMQYLEKNFAQMLADSKQPELSSSAAYLRYQCHLELSQYGDAAADLQSRSGAPDAFDEVRLSVGWRMEGTDQKAAEWQSKACAHFDQGLQEQRRIATMLRRAADVSWEEIQDLTVEPRQKTILLIALAQQSPDHRSELLALAEKLNYSRLFPYHFHQRAIATLRGQN